MKKHLDWWPIDNMVRFILQRHRHATDPCDTQILWQPFFHTVSKNKNGLVYLLSAFLWPEEFNVHFQTEISYNEIKINAFGGSDT